MNRQLVSVTDAVPYQEFAKLIGKTPRAVRGMIEKGKLPVIEITDPQSVSGRAGEYWVTLKEPERRYLFLLKNSGQYCLTTIQRQFKLQLIKLRFIAFLKGTYPRGLCSPCGKESKYRYV